MKSKIYILASLLISIGVFGYGSAEAKACGDGEYVVSAYYSPLPGQSRYATGSYVGDIRLNGGGVTTASGVKVADAPGAFLAAPSCFEFGTVLEFEGMGNYIILDRGGAIKGARLDLWMGYGDEGLNAALNWGKRTVSAKSLGIDPGVELAAKAEWKLPPNYTFLENVDSNPFDSLDNIKMGDTGPKVAVLQQLLSDIGYFEGEIDGYFGVSTKDALIAMDADYGEIVSINISPIGALGNTTISELENLVVVARRKIEESIPSSNLGFGSTGNDVLNLQKALLRLGYDVDLNEFFDDKTQAALVSYQIDEGIIASADDLGAGFFGEVTQNKLKKTFSLALPDEINQERPDESYEFLSQSEQFSENLRLGLTSDEVRKLQEVLARMQLFKLEPTGYFGPVTQHAVIKLQLKNGIITNTSELGAGTVGPSTRRFLNSFQNSYLKRTSLDVKSYDLVKNQLFDSELRFGDKSNDVFKLQKFLQEQGYLNSVLLTKYYGENTFEAMAQFKLDNSLISNQSIKESGNLDEETIDYINKRFR